MDYRHQPEQLVQEKKSFTDYIGNAWSGFKGMFSSNPEVDTGPNATGGGKKQKKRKVGKSKGRTLRKGKSSGRKGKSSGRKGKSRGRKSHSRKH